MTGTLKTELQRIIDTLPDDCTLDDFNEELHFREKVHKGFRAMAEGRTISREEAD